MSTPSPISPEALQAALDSPHHTVAVTPDGDLVTDGHYEVATTYVRVVSWPRFTDRPASQDVITVHVVVPRA